MDRGASPWGRTELDTTEMTVCMHAHGAAPPIVMEKMHENADCSGKGLKIPGGRPLGMVLSRPQLPSVEGVGSSSRRSRFCVPGVGLTHVYG